jgi:hypothetical protein
MPKTLSRGCTSRARDANVVQPSLAADADDRDNLSAKMTPDQIAQAQRLRWSMAIEKTGMNDSASLALTDGEKRVLITLLKRTLAEDRFPLARFDPLNRSS